MDLIFDVKMAISAYIKTLESDCVTWDRLGVNEEYIANMETDIFYLMYNVKSAGLINVLENDAFWDGKESYKWLMEQ